MEKQIRWIIALNLIAEKTNKAVEREMQRVQRQIPQVPQQTISKPGSRTFVRQGDKIVML